MTKRNKKNRRWLWISLGVLLLLIIGAVIRSKNKPRGQEVTIEKVQKRSIVETVSASGKVFPETEVKISSDVSGEIVQLEVEEGDSVKAGQLLARIDPDTYESAVERGKASVNNAMANLSNSNAGIERSRAQLLQAKAQVEQIEANLKNTRTIHERNIKLFDEGVISQADFDGSLSALEALEANLRAAKANVRSLEANFDSAEEMSKAAKYTVQSAKASLKELQTSLRRTSLYAPTNGIVSKLNVEEGERVVGTIQMTGTELMRVANMNIMEVQVEVNENDVLRVSLGDSTIIEVDAYQDTKFVGSVTEIASSAANTSTLALTSDQVTNFVVKVRIDPASYQHLVTPKKPFPFRPGMSASVDIITQNAKNVLSIPIQAVTTREKEGENSNVGSDDFREVVFVVLEDTVAVRDVNTGIQDDTYIQLLSGLQIDDEVVIGPYSAISRKLEQGDKIRIKEEKDEEKEDKD